MSIHLQKLKLKYWTLPCQEGLKFGAGDPVVCKTAYLIPVFIRGAAKAAPKFECSLRRGIRLELERVRHQVQAKRRFKRARERSAERQQKALQRGCSFEEAASAGALPP